jgi:hypothetical protein
MTRRSLGIVAGIALAVIPLGLGTAASFAQTGKPAAKKTAEPATRVPAPTPMPPGKPGGTLNVMLARISPRDSPFTSRRRSPSSSRRPRASTTW